MQWNTETFLELIRTTSSQLPEDIEKTITRAQREEEKGSAARFALDSIVENIKLAKENGRPLCQDTGSIHIYATLPKDADENAFREAFCLAIGSATEKGYLRQNSVDPITGKNSGNNLGPGSPAFHVIRHAGNQTEIRLLLKGGGCENVSAQYALPDKHLDAFRDIEGARRCILDAVVKAQGKGCAPGILGVCIGGDRTTGYEFSKEQLLRKLDEPNEDAVLRKLEEDIMRDANELGIGPMGFGGKTTLLGCLIGKLNRIPASYYVSVTYMCWAYRRQGVRLDNDGKIAEWLY